MCVRVASSECGREETGGRCDVIVEVSGIAAILLCVLGKLSVRMFLADMLSNIRDVGVQFDTKSFSKRSCCCYCCNH
jgi:hypothetical protein